MPNSAFYYEENNIRVYPERIIYLNVRPTPQVMNCSLFTLGGADLEALNRVEWIYEPRCVTDSLQDVEIVGGDALLYAGRAEYILNDHEITPREGAIRSSYLTIVQMALSAGDSRFRTEYEESTDPIPKHLVVKDAFDVERPNPWSDVGLTYRPDDRLV